MKIFVISLKSSSERRALITKNLNELGLEFEILDAIDGRSLTESEIVLSTRALNYAVERGEIGCSLSHLSVYARMIAMDISDALVLEDDAIPSPELPEILRALEAKHSDKPLVTVLTKIDQYIAAPEQQLSDNHCIHRFIEGTGAYGYIINKTAARKLIEFLYPVWLVSDRWQFIKENNICDIQCIIPYVISHPPYKDGELHKISTIHTGANLSDIKSNIWRQIKKNRRFTVKLRRALWLFFARRLVRIEKCR